MQDNKWVRLLAYITGLVNQRLLLQSCRAALNSRNFLQEADLLQLSPGIRDSQCT
jgi:hypothetical protein